MQANRAGKERATAEWRTAEALADLQVTAQEYEGRLREAIEGRIAAEKAAAEAYQRLAALTHADPSETF